MSVNTTQNSTSLLDSGSESGAKKLGESIANRALSALVDGVKDKYGRAQIRLGAAFERYLKNATQRYNQVRTLATGTTPRTIIGPENIYVNIGIRYGERVIDTSTVDSILQISNNILISGTGGIGKSMLMRYLFLNTANRGEYIPVMLKLQRISNQTSGQISILDLTYSCMKELDVELPKDQFEYSLRLGKYLFLMDGFDEVKESQSSETAEAIQNFCAKYPNNPCIITSRPKRETSPLETFTEVKSMALSKQQAVLLASKLWKEDEKTREFCRQLSDELYEKHQDFAENPLLLSMMFLTFMRNNSIPDHLADFYSKAYDALYSTHDSSKGYYQREFQCKTLDESNFKLLLSHFCFQTYFKEVYEFTKVQLLSYLEKSTKKLELADVKATDFLEDLLNVVCILIEDGDIYRFSHRSFQTYFAACYTSNILTDEQQKKLFSSSLSDGKIFWTMEDYYELLSQIEPQRFAVNALEDELHSIQKTVNKSSNPDVCILKMQFNGFELSQRKDRNAKLFFRIDTSSSRYYNIISLFRRFVIRNSYIEHQEQKQDVEFIKSWFDRLAVSEMQVLSFEDIDSSEFFTNKERNDLYAAIARTRNIPRLRTAISEWLNQLDVNRKKLDADNFIDDL